MFASRFARLASQCLMATPALLLMACLAEAQTFTVTNSNDSGAGSLRQAIDDLNALAPGSSGTIEFNPGVYSITLASRLPAILRSVSINPTFQDVTIDGNNAHRVFFVDAGSAQLTGMTIINGKGKGGNGGSGGGGGGMGAGGGLFVNSTATAFLNQMSFIDNAAFGGTGGSSATSASSGYDGGGGGGLYGNGGLGGGVLTGGGGGGYYGDGTQCCGGIGGAAFGTHGTAGGDGSNFGGNGGDGGGGGGGGDNGTNIIGAGDGGDFGGGGGNFDAGSGGYGGGGGSGGSSYSGGSGGFGGGGGSGFNGAFGGNFGGRGGDNTSGTVAAGGGGAGLGGAIFVRDGGSLFLDSNSTFSGNSVMGGYGGGGDHDGDAAGQAFFLHNTEAQVALAFGTELTINQSIGGTGTNSGISLYGGGTLSMVGAFENTYTGLTKIGNATLKIDDDNKLGSSGAKLVLNGSLVAQGDITMNRAVESTANGGSLDTNGHDITINSSIQASGRGLFKRGNGNLVLRGTGNVVDDWLLQGGTLDLNDAQQVTGSVIYGQGGKILASTGSFTFANHFETSENYFVDIEIPSTSQDVDIDDPTDAGISGPGGLYKRGSGYLFLHDQSDYTGPTMIEQGYVVLKTNEGLSDQTDVTAGTNIVFGTAALRIDTGDLTIDELSGVGLVQIYKHTGTLTIGADNGSSIYDGQLTDFDGTGHLRKVGTGTWTVTRTMNYKGQTEVLEGEMHADGEGASQTSRVEIASGARLRLSNEAPFVSKNEFVVDGILVGNGTATGLIRGSGSIRARTALTIGDTKDNAVQFDGDVTVGRQALSPLPVPGTIITSPARLDVVDNGVAELNGDVTLIDGSTLSSTNGIALGYGASLSVAGGISGSPALPGQFGVYGTATVEGPLVNHGLVRGSLLSTQKLTLAGDVSGDGNYSGSVQFDAGFSPAEGAATITAQNVSFGAAAEVLMEIGGITAGSEHDLLTIGGIAKLNGTLNIELIGGFVPAAGDIFQLFDWSGPVSGNFNSIALPMLPGELEWDTDSLLSAGRVEVVSPAGLDGDFNGDGKVDGADFLVWQRDPSVGNLADWQANYGATSAVAASTAVPEPLGATLVTFSLVVLVFARRRYE